MVSPKFTDTNSILLVDGTNLLLRILHSKTKENTLITPSELIDICTIIFISQITHVVKKYSCNRLLVAFDLGGSLRKKAAYAAYKQNREFQAVSSTGALSEPSTDLFVNLKETVVAACNLFKIPVIMEYGIEADDILGIATEELTKLGIPVVVLSNDSDFLQLLKYNNVTCSIPYKKADVTQYNFTEYFSASSKSSGVAISAPEYLFYKVLVGDSSDNIAGIPKVGFKTLHKLLNEQLAGESPDVITTYMSDGLAYARLLANRNVTKFEKLISTNIDLIERNYKLIELSSRVISSHAVQLTLNKLKEHSERPNRKDVIREMKSLLKTTPSVEFVMDSVFQLSKTYLVD